MIGMVVLTSFGSRAQYEPAEHGDGTGDIAGQNWPGRHSVGCTVAFPQNEPAGHTWQSATDAPEMASL
jgi:hypothetical protein